MSAIMNKIINFFYLYPLPSRYLSGLPPQGKELKAKLSPLGETGKGVILKNMDVIDYYHYKI